MCVPLEWGAAQGSITKVQVESLESIFIRAQTGIFRGIFGIKLQHRTSKRVLKALLIKRYSIQIVSKFTSTKIMKPWAL